MIQSTGPDYYLQRKNVLLKQHDKLLKLGETLLFERYGDSFMELTVRHTREEFEHLIPEIPYIGGKANSLTDTLEQMTSLLALYRTMKANEKSVEEIGELVHEMAMIWAAQYPALMRRMIGRLYMSAFWRRRTERKALISQERQYPGNFVFEIVDGSSEKFEWGINYLECGVVKFFHQQNADEFTPYMCLIDYLLYPQIGIHLERHGTIAGGCTHCDFRFGQKGEKHTLTS